MAPLPTTGIVWQSSAADYSENKRGKIPKAARIVYARSSVQPLPITSTTQPTHWTEPIQQNRTSQQHWLGLVSRAPILPNSQNQPRESTPQVHGALRPRPFAGLHYCNGSTNNTSNPPGMFSPNISPPLPCRWRCREEGVL